MRLLGKTLDDLDESDISRFVSDEVAEGKTLDYKRELPSDQTEEKKEFLADVCSFANTAGGHLIFGVIEAKGAATDIVGVAATDIDAAILRIENSIRDGIQPRVPAVRTKGVTLTSGRVILILEIGRSWAAPHMVTYRGSSRFYARNSAGKYQLDVQEIRAAFVGAETQLTKFREFRSDRFAKILGNELGFELRHPLVTVVHVSPLGAFSSPRVIGLDEMRRPGTENFLRPISSSGWSDRVTFDGYMRYSSASIGSHVLGYVTVFRNGIIEAVDCSMLTSPHDATVHGFPTGVYEPRIASAVGSYIKYSHQIGLELPYLVSLSVLNTRGLQMLFNSYIGDANHPVDRDHLLFPEILVEDVMASAPIVLKPAFDALWNACGFEQSGSYDAKGVWKHAK